MEDEREGDEFEVIVLSVGLPVNGRPYSTIKENQNTEYHAARNYNSMYTSLSIGLHHPCSGIQRTNWFH